MIQSLQETLGGKPKTFSIDRVKEMHVDLMENDDGLYYLEKVRGLSKETIQKFLLGYNKELHAISIPYFKRGEVVAIKYRFITPEGDRRYHSEKGSQPWVFNEDGIDASRSKGAILITEGEFDAMACWQAGIRNVIGCGGKDAYGVWIELLDKIPKIYIAYDNDEAGKTTSLKFAERLGTDKCMEVALPDDTKDLNDFFHKNTKEEFGTLIKESKPYYKYEFKGIGDVINNLRFKQEETIELSKVPGVKFEKDWLVMVSGVSNVGKCHAKGTEILMHDGSIKKVEDIMVGDKLMGEDSKPKTVLSLANGTDEMYRVSERGEHYDVNASHILSLKVRSTDKKTGKTILRYKEIPVKDLYNSKTSWRKTHSGWKTGVDFTEKSISIAPYILGLWLGDGSSSKPEITSMDDAIVKEIHTYADRIGCGVRIHNQINNKSSVYSFRTDRGLKNPFLSGLQHYNLINNKHIPFDFKTNSRERRLSLLAGLIDSDGYLGKTDRGESYEISQKNKTLADDIVYLVRSLGLRAKITKVSKSIKTINFIGEYYLINIYGDLSIIPCKLERKKSSFVSKKRWWLSSIDIQPIGKGEYFGFTLDGNGLYLMGNFTVTHNTSVVLNFADELTKKNIPTLILPFERGVSAVGERFLQVMFNKTKDEFGYMNDTEWNQLIMECGERPVYFALPKKNDITDTIIKSKRLFDTRVVIIDHMDYLVRNVAGNREAEISNTLQALKRVAEENKIIMMIVSHTRKVQTSGSMIQREPTMEDLKGSSSLFQDPECVIMLTKPEDGQIKVNVVKNKGEMKHGLYEINVSTGKMLKDLNETAFKL